MLQRNSSNRPWAIAAGVVAVAVLAACGSMSTGKSSKTGMSFFVTSTGPGQGANLGGLAGADRQCQTLAAAAGAGNRSWRAYLSQQPTANLPGINARDRIGMGPWLNAKGAVIASDVAQLHGANNLTKQTALTETGALINGRGDTPNMHDMLTGSQADGRAFPAGKDMTCSNWRNSGDGSAMVGHHDRIGLREDDASKSWNASHPSRGCSQDALKASGGNGLFYCFAAN